MSIYPDNSIILAPLSGFTDLPFRNSARRYGCTFAFTEMIDAGSLVFGNEKTRRFLKRGENEKWLGAQIIGADHSHLRQAVEIINQHNFDVLDFNLGCPAPKVIKKGEGAILAQNPINAVMAFEQIVKASRFKVTAKIRILDELDPGPTIFLARKLVNSGATSITIHGRLRKNFYSGPVFHNIISAVRSELSIPIIANGGVVDQESFLHLRRQTGCSRIMVARGAMGNPWLFRELIDPGNYIPPDIDEFSDEMTTHILDIISLYGEPLGLRIARKIILDYLRGRGFQRTLKNSVCKLITKSDFLSFMKQIRDGPSPRYIRWLTANPAAPRRLNMNL